MDLTKVIQVSASGMTAQTLRLRTIAENIANAESLGETPGAQPYQRKLVTFKNILNRATGFTNVKVDRISKDQSEFQKKFDPQHPAADKDGYVLTPNVNSLVELMDMRQAQRSYEANLSVIEVSKSMLARTLDLLRG
jgi:flagellar basal-body rod protein FlgC